MELYIHITVTLIFHFKLIFFNISKRRCIVRRQVDEPPAEGRWDADGPLSNESAVEFRGSEQHREFCGGRQGVRRAGDVAVSAVGSSRRPQGTAALRPQLPQPTRAYRTYSANSLFSAYATMSVSVCLSVCL